MAHPSRRRLIRTVAVVGCLVGAIGWLLGTGGASRPSAVSAPNSLRVLQMNLCNSGIADCYTGRSVAEASALIRAERPDIVTLNEVCREDVALLGRTLSDDANRGGGVLATAFQAAIDRRTGNPVRCRNGQRYGIGLLARVGTPYRGYTTEGARYPMQDGADPEERVWLCLHAIGHFYACTTHLANGSRAVAISQCRYLMGATIPALRGPGREDAVILGADLNLGDDQSPNARSCMPPGFVRADDGGTQDILASSRFTLASSSSISMRGTTDHPSLLADLSPVGAASW